MSTTITPPPAAPTPDGGAPTRSSARVVSIVAIVVGAVLIGGTVLSGAWSALWNGPTRVQHTTASVDRVTDLDVDISSGRLTITYDDVDEATLDVEGPDAEYWRLTRDGDTLTVKTDRPWRFGWGLFRGPGGDDAVLTLPIALQDAALDAELELGAGEILAEGSFGQLQIDVGAGAVSVDGSAETLDATLSAGFLHLDLDNVRTADLEVSAGRVDGRLGGTTPQSVTLDVSAGRVDLTLPEARYAVTSDVSAGKFSHSLDVDASASARVDVSVSAGTVSLRSAR